MSRRGASSKAHGGDSKLQDELQKLREEMADMRKHGPPSRRDDSDSEPRAKRGKPSSNAGDDGLLYWLSVTAYANLATVGVRLVPVSCFVAGWRCLQSRFAAAALCQSARASQPYGPYGGLANFQLKCKSAHDYLLGGPLAKCPHADDVRALLMRLLRTACMRVCLRTLFYVCWHACAFRHLSHRMRHSVR